MTTASVLHELLARRIVVLDGAMGTMLAARPDDALVQDSGARVAAIHDAYLSAGADIIRTNTFQATEYDANVAAARRARTAADNFNRRMPERRRLVAGVIGPVRGPADIVAIHRRQARGLIDGGVDLLLVETIMGAAQARAAATALRDEFGGRGVLPLMFSATVDRRGLLLSGETLDAFVAAVRDVQPFSIGLNCAHGAQEIAAHIARLAGLTDAYISCHPSAGLPDANGAYGESADDVAAVLRRLAEEGLANIVGGCCGTTPEYTSAMADAVRTVPPDVIRTGRAGWRSSPADPS